MKSILFGLLIVSTIIIVGKPSNTFAQGRLHQRTDSIALLVQKYLTAKDVAAIYALTSEYYHKAQSLQAFSSFAEAKLFTLGTVLKATPISFNAKIGKYKLDYNLISLQMSIGLDTAGKIQMFLFEPYIANKPVPVATSNPRNTYLEQKIDSVARMYIQKGNTSGMSIGILQNGKISTYGYGETAKGNGKLPDANTLFEIGSITKTFTATLLAWYADKGMVNLTDPVTRYLPDSVAQNTALKNISLMQLSNHTSGLPRLPSNFTGYAGYNPKDPYKNYSVPLMFQYLRSCTLTNKPGAAYDYSNLGVALLGVILEKVSGKNFEQMVGEIICHPLHMQNTVQHLNSEQAGRLVPAVYDERGKATPVWTFNGMTAHGALKSTVNDLLLYARANMRNGTSHLQKAMTLTHELTFSKGTRMGLGWHIVGIAGVDYFFHNGGTAGSSSFLIFNNKKQLALVILSNAAEGVDDIGVAITKLLQ
jgi:CubicO group peptidase (beta-lactamase class C family)